MHHYVYTSEGNPPEDATHVSIHKSITVIPEKLFSQHPNIIELICHINVKKIEEEAFYCCPRLKRLVMPGVEEMEWGAFLECEAIEHIECEQLEIIRPYAFSDCTSLGNIDLPSAKIVERGAFDNCTSLSDVKFGRNLESIGQGAFYIDTNLIRIQIPLKNDLFNYADNNYADNDVFVGCGEFREVGLVDEATIYETADALLLDEWKNDMNQEIDSINKILPNVDAGGDDEDHVGDKR